MSYSMTLTNTDYGRPMRPFFIEIQNFGLGETNLADKFLGIRGIFDQTIKTHLGTVSPLSIFFIIQSLFLQKIKLLHPNPEYLFGI